MAKQEEVDDLKQLIEDTESRVRSLPDSHTKTRIQMNLTKMRKLMVEGYFW